MKVLLWWLLGFATLLPAVTCWVYFKRRLGTRRKQLLQTLLSLSLDDEYMLMRHGQKYNAWRSCEPEKRIEDFEHQYFNEDFKAGYSPEDYVWPVLLFVVLCAVGWFLTFHVIFPGFSSVSDADGFLPVGFVFGFVGAYMACVLVIFDGFRRYDLDPNLYYSVTFRVLFASFAAYVVTLAMPAPAVPIVAAGFGLFPLQQTWSFITERAAKLTGAAKQEEELGAELAKIQGLEHQGNRQKLLDVGITTVQGLATADPLLLFFRTTFALRTVVDMIDKAILYLYIGDKVTELRKHGINGVIELVALAKLAEKVPAYRGYSDERNEKLNTPFDQIAVDDLVKDIARVLDQTPAELLAFIYNMYYDPMVKFIYEIWGRYLNRPVERTLGERPPGPDASSRMDRSTPPPDPAGGGRTADTSRLAGVE